MKHPTGVREITGLTFDYAPAPRFARLRLKEIVESRVLATREGPKSPPRNWIRRQPPQANRGFSGPTLPIVFQL